jgi:hypothetical protein
LSGRVVDFPYIGALNNSVRRLEELEDEAKPPLYFLQASAAGQPLAVANWFEYEDTDLDFNDYENYPSWFLPEVVPHVQSHVAVDATTLKKHANALWKLPPDFAQKAAALDGTICLKPMPAPDWRSRSGFGYRLRNRGQRRQR